MSANVEILNDISIINVHGRGSFSIPYQQVETIEGEEVARDLSSYTLMFEVKEIGIRKEVPLDPQDATVALVQMNRTEIELLTDERAQFALIDETSQTFPKVVWEGFIKLRGYEGAPE